ncbi:MAG: VCBS repeat-containing protein [Planctomycetes bacterium]|nr:VCBS repeat-containing protein [Planctomycetota bacterium]
MSTEADLLIGRHAVARGWVSEARLAEGIAQQERENAEGRAPRRLGMILVERGDLTPEQLADLLDEQARAIISAEDLALGATLIRNGMATPDAVDRALTMQRTLRNPRPLGEILVEQGQITPQALTATLSAQARMVEKTKSAGGGVRRFGRYEILTELGRGGMGVVYRARDPQLNRTVALKVMMGGNDPSEIERFRREAAAMARLRHPHIIPVFDVGEEEGRPYYTMEMVEGESLADILERMRVLPLEAALKIVRDVALALGEAHRNGLVHRDVKPGNVLIAKTHEMRGTTDDGRGTKGEGRETKNEERRTKEDEAETERKTETTEESPVHDASNGAAPPRPPSSLPPPPKTRVSGDTSLILSTGVTGAYRVLLSDFGLVRDLESARLTRSGDVMGTPLYMSPEQARGDARAMGPLADVYSLGAVLYELVSGRPPFVEPDLPRLLAQIQLDDPPSLRTLVPGLPRDVETIVMKTLAKDPARRYPSADDFAEDIHRYLEGDIILARPASFAYRLAKRIQRHKAASAAIAVGSAFALTLGWRFLGPAYVTLRVTPESAAVTFNGRPAGAQRAFTVWPPGQVNISAEVTTRYPIGGEGGQGVVIRTATNGRSVSSGENVLIEIAVPAGTGRLTVPVSPANATLHLTKGDIRHALVGPQRQTEIEEGIWGVSVEAPDHIARQAAVTVKPGSETSLAEIRLEHETGLLTVEATIPQTRLRVFPATREEFEVALAPGWVRPQGGAARLQGAGRPRLLWQAMNRFFDEHGPMDPEAAAALPGAGKMTRPPGPSRASTTSPLRPIADHEFPSTVPLLDLLLPVDLLRMQTGCYRLLYVNQECTNREQYVRILPAKDVAARSAVLETLRNGYSARGLRITRSEVDGWGLTFQDEAEHQWTVFPEVPGETRCKAALFRRERWTFQAAAAVRAPPALADLDADGIRDVVVAAEDGTVYALSGENSALIWNCATRSERLRSPVCGDLNADGTVDVVVSSEPGGVFAISGRDGHRLWIYTVGGESRATPVLGDLDRDGTPDVVMGSGSGGVHAISGRTGTRLWLAQLPSRVANRPALADLDEDGTVDVVVSGDSGQVFWISGRDGSELRPPATIYTRANTDAQGRSSPAMADLDGDGFQDCIVGSLDNEVFALSGRARPSGRPAEVLWRVPTPTQIFSTAALGDLNGDGIPDALVVLRDRDVVALSGRGGDTLWTARTRTAAGASGPLEDVDGDLIPDAVLTLADGSLSALSGRNGDRLWEFRTEGPVTARTLGDLDGDGSPECVIGSETGRVTVLSTREGRVRWDFEANGRVMVPPTLADLNADGFLDAVAGSIDTRIYAISGKDGQPLWIHDADEWIIQPCDLADLNGDGTLDCLQPRRNGKILALSGIDGCPLWDTSLTFSPYVWATAMDRNGDRTPDCIVGADSSGLVALSGKDGTPLSPPDMAHVTCSLAALGRLDDDDLPDAVVQGAEGRLIAFSGRTGERLWERRFEEATPSPASLADFDGDRRLDPVSHVAAAGLQWYLRIGNGRDTASSRDLNVGDAPYFWQIPILGRLNDDASPDGVLSCGNGTIIGVSGADGRECWRYATRRTGMRSWPGLADLDGDGLSDAVTGTSLGDGGDRVIALSGRDGHLFWEFTTGGAVWGGPALADLDGDGIIECVIAGGGSDRRIYALQASVSEANPEGKAEAAGSNRATSMLLRARRRYVADSWTLAEADGAAGLAALERQTAGTNPATGSTAEPETLLLRGSLTGLLGMIRLSMGRREEARKDLEAASRDLPSDPDIRLGLALTTEDPEGASRHAVSAFLSAPIEMWDRLTTGHGLPAPYSPEPTTLLAAEVPSPAEAFSRSRHLARLARGSAERLRDGGADSGGGRTSDVRFARALALLAAGRPRDALDLLDLLVRDEPRSLDALRFRGRARLDAGDPAGAIVDGRETLAFSGLFPERESWLSEAEMRLRAQEAEERGDWKTAYEAYDSALNVRPMSAVYRLGYLGAADRHARALVDSAATKPGEAPNSIASRAAVAVALAERQLGYARAFAAQAEGAGDGASAEDVPPLPSWAASAGYTWPQTLAKSLETLALAYLARGGTADTAEAIAALEEALRIGPAEGDRGEMIRKLIGMKGSTKGH